MDASLLRRVTRPAAGLCARAAAPSSLLAPAALSRTAPAPAAVSLAAPGRRYQSSRNKTKRALNIGPHASFSVDDASTAFRPNKHATGAAAGVGSTSTILGTLTSPSGAAATILYNPPASAPSVYQTPFKFLPKCDPRRVVDVVSLFAQQPPTPAVPPAPPVPHHSYAPTEKYHLTEDDVAEMRRLRSEDPLTWSILALGRKYNCSPIFVKLATKGCAGREHTDKMVARVQAAKDRWGPIRAKARADRAKRREMLYNGEL